MLIETRRPVPANKLIKIEFVLNLQLAMGFPDYTVQSLTLNGTNNYSPEQNLSSGKRFPICELGDGGDTDHGGGGGGGGGRGEGEEC